MLCMRGPAGAQAAAAGADPQTVMLTSMRLACSHSRRRRSASVSGRAWLGTPGSAPAQGGALPSADQTGVEALRHRLPGLQATWVQSCTAAWHGDCSHPRGSCRSPCSPAQEALAAEPGARQVLVVVGDERDTRDGHYSYASVGPFAAHHVLACSNMGTVQHWINVVRAPRQPARPSLSWVLDSGNVCVD